MPRFLPSVLGSTFNNLSVGTTNPYFNPGVSLGSANNLFYGLTTTPGTRIVVTNPTTTRLPLIDTTAPTGSFVINNNSLYTNSRQVTLNFSDVSGDVTKIKIGNGATGSYQNPVTFTNPYTYTLPNNGDGLYTLRVRFMDAADNESSGVIADRIFLNTTSPMATDDIVSTVKNDWLMINPADLLANDADAGGDPLRVMEVKNAAKGEVVLSDSRIIFFPENNFTGRAGFDYTVTDGINEATAHVNIRVRAPVNNNQILVAPEATVSASLPQVVIDRESENSTINVPADVPNSSLDLSNLTSESGNNRVATVSADITVNAETSLGNITVQIPANIQIQGPVNWTGTINNPRIEDNSSVSVPAVNGYNTTTHSVIEVGFGDIPLSFNKAVRLSLAGQTGRLAGYSRAGVFTPITTACSDDFQQAGDNLPAEGDCKIDTGEDLVIWTKHFTKFATYTQTQSASGSSSSSSSSSSVGSDGGDGLGCAVHDCSVRSAPAQNQTSVVFTQPAAAGFAQGILGITSNEQTGGNVGIGQVEGISTPSAIQQTSATDAVQGQTETQESPFNTKVVIIVVAIILAGFGIFKLLIK